MKYLLFLFSLVLFLGCYEIEKPYDYVITDIETYDDYWRYYVTPEGVSGEKFNFRDMPNVHHLGDRFKFVKINSSKQDNESHVSEVIDTLGFIYHIAVRDDVYIKAEMKPECEDCMFTLQPTDGSNYVYTVNVNGMMPRVWFSGFDDYTEIPVSDGDIVKWYRNKIVE